MPTTLLAVRVSNHGARVRVALLSVLAVVLLANAGMLALLARVIGPAARIAVPIAVLGALLLLAAIVAARRLRGTLELYVAEQGGPLGARLVSASGSEWARVDGPLAVVRGLVPIGRRRDLMLSIGSATDSGSGDFPIVIHCDASGGPAEWKETWGAMDHAVWKRGHSRYRCFKLPEVVNMIDAQEARAS